LFPQKSLLRLEKVLSISEADEVVFVIIKNKGNSSLFNLIYRLEKGFDMCVLFKILQKLHSNEAYKPGEKTGKKTSFFTCKKN